MTVVPHRFGSNRWAIGAIILVVVLQLLTLHVPPLAAVLGVGPLSSAEWAIVLPFALVPAVFGLLLGLLRRSRS
jgi:hypothetical protein